MKTLAAIALAIFCWLAITSLQYEQHGYTGAEREAMNQLVASLQPQTFRQRQAAALRDVWGIENEAQEVELWK